MDSGCVSFFCEKHRWNDGFRVFQQAVKAKKNKIIEECMNYKTVARIMGGLSVAFAVANAILHPFDGPEDPSSLEDNAIITNANRMVLKHSLRVLKYKSSKDNQICKDFLEKYQKEALEDLENAQNAVNAASFRLLVRLSATYTLDNMRHDREAITNNIDHVMKEINLIARECH